MIYAMETQRCYVCESGGVHRCDASGCDRVRLGQPYTNDQCRLCWLFFHDAQWNLAHGGDGKVTHASRKLQPQPKASEQAKANRVKIKARLSVPCIHLGDETGERHDCIVCGGEKSQAVLACALHGRCTWKRRLVYKDQGGAQVEVRWCVTCDDYQGE